MKLQPLLLLAFFLMCHSKGEEYLYPVGFLQEKDKNVSLFLLYQKSLQHLELWQWNPTTGIAHKALMSSYTPAGLRMLPNNKGFSFIDEGSLRIKYFDKRSPGTIDFPYPIYDFHTIEWIDEKHAVFSAKKEDVFCIFIVHAQHRTAHCLIDIPECDCMYPQFLNNELFFIMRKKNQEFCIVKTSIVLEQYDQDLLASNEEIIKNPIIKPVIILQENAIAFLHMSSPTEGYFMEHPRFVSRREPALQFNCYRIQYSHDSWNKELLFPCAIPMRYLIDGSGTRLYESILPFLPRYTEGAIFFMHGDQSDTTAIYCYNTRTKAISATSNTPEKRDSISLFGPLDCNDQIFYGGEVNPKNESPIFQMEENGSLRVSLPHRPKMFT